MANEPGVHNDQLDLGLPDIAQTLGAFSYRNWLRRAMTRAMRSNDVPRFIACHDRLVGLRPVDPDLIPSFSEYADQIEITTRHSEVLSYEEIGAS